MRKLLGFARRKHLTTLIKYGIVGVINTLVDFSVSSLCHYVIGLSAELATASGYICGIVCSYILNGRFTFRTKGSIWKFLLVNGVSLALSVGLTHLLASIGLEYAIAKALTIIVTTTVNYIGYKLLVFKVKK
jgi:putative flippase GtrA